MSQKMSKKLEMENLLIECLLKIVDVLISIVALIIKKNQSNFKDQDYENA